MSISVPIEVSVCFGVHLGSTVLTCFRCSFRLFHGSIFRSSGATWVAFSNVFGILFLHLSSLWVLLDWIVARAEHYILRLGVALPALVCLFPNADSGICLSLLFLQLCEFVSSPLDTPITNQMETLIDR